MAPLRRSRRPASHPHDPAHLHRGRAWGLLLTIGVALGGLLVFTAITGLGWWRPTAPAQGTFVVEVVDGDTIRVSIDGRTDNVRLLGIDTPETVHPTKPVECFGPEASARTKELLAPGTAVVLERDTEERDLYGRLLAYVVREEDGLFVNVALVREGMAEVLTIAPNVAHTDAFRSAAAEARREGRGLWSACPGAVPSGP